MFVFNWLKGTLKSIGLEKKKANVLMLGVENSGKTTLVHALVEGSKYNFHGNYYLSDSKQGATIEDCSLNFKMFRKPWREELGGDVQGVIYLIDVADPTRFDEFKKELTRYLSAPELEGIPFAILGNKIDKKDAVTEDEFRKAFELSENSEKLSERYGRPIEVFMCSIAKGIGYETAAKWLSRVIQQQQQLK